MLYAQILIAACSGLLIGGSLGFVLGRYIWNLLDTIEMFKLKGKEPKPFIEKPTVTMGVLDPPRSIGNTGDKAKTFGIVESKTPELLDWERNEEIKKQVLGQ